MATPLTSVPMKPPPAASTAEGGTGPIVARSPGNSTWVTRSELAKTSTAPIGYLDQGTSEKQ